MIFFVLYQYVTFPNIISELADGIQNENLSKGRDKLMLLLLQFISGSIQKNPPQDFVEVNKNKIIPNKRAGCVLFVSVFY